MDLWCRSFESPPIHCRQRGRTQLSQVDEFRDGRGISRQEDDEVLLIVAGNFELDVIKVESTGFGVTKSLS